MCLGVEKPQAASFEALHKGLLHASGSFMMYWDPYFQSLIGILFAARLTGIVVSWLLPLGLLKGALFLTRGGAKAN